MTTLPIKGRDHIIYLDNLFTNVKLLKYGRERGWGVIGTYIGKSGIIKEFCEMKK